MSTSDDKNETSRFLGEGVSFKAKLIGILEVSEARGDRMCQEALSDLKMAIRAAGEHKQRITINIAIDGLRLRDEKTGDSLYHHPVHKISFIAQDMTDSRAFGYIFGSPDSGHRFFGIKTDKAASQVVIAMRDLFQVVFALKKKEIELAKQHLDKNRYGTSSIFSDSAISSAKALTQDSSTKPPSDSKTTTNSSESKSGAPAVADLVDLELELNSLQQGITQMERITPSDPFGSKDDPFGDSFTSYPPKPILPPPPSTRERSSRTSESSSIFSPKTPHTTASLDNTNVADVSLFRSAKDFSFPQDLNSSREEPSSGDWFTPSGTDKIFEEPPLIPETSKEQQELSAKQDILSQFDVFTELDPLEDPFDKTDPFAEADFAKQDPFESDNFGVDFKIFNKNIKPSDFAEKFKFPVLSNNELPTLFSSSLSKSPNKGGTLEKQMSVVSTSPRNVLFTKQNTFDVKFDKFEEKSLNGLSQIHENRSLDMSSESECAPEPPPRPASNLTQIKPPPLPPKKQPGDICTRPPPRPPHSEDSHYDYMDNYETGPNSLELRKNTDKGPSLPAPARKAKFECDFMSAPDRPKKQFSLQSSEEDYLTPISFPQQQTEVKSVTRHTGPILLPPPQRSAKKQNVSQRATVASLLELKPNVTTSTTPDKQNCFLEGLDITLSQLTLSGLNELATKLKIPTGQLSNMTLVQLTSYISNFIRNGSESENAEEAPTFKADFANFNNFNSTNSEPHDKYAVFRELFQEEEIKQTKIDTEPEEIQEEEDTLNEQNLNNLDEKSNEYADATDKYAALREIVEIEMKRSQKEESVEENNQNEDETKDDDVVQNNLDESADEDTKIKNETNIIHTEKSLMESKENQIISPHDKVIEYNDPIENQNDLKLPTPVKSPVKIKSPIPTAITDIVQTNNRLTSGSLSDAVSGSSPEVDNTASTSEVPKTTADATGESWAIFDQPNLSQPPTRDKQTVQSEEGVSPWSSDSKEFGNGSPTDWRHRTDSGSGGDLWNKRVRRDQEGWWDTSAEPEVQYHPSNRRSTDSYEDECYECHDRPQRRRRQMTWGSHGSQGAGGHSSSSRDVSPWEEEPRRRELRELRDHREMWMRHPRPPSFERRDRRHDSWDEEDDFEYDEEHSGRYRWPERHSGREPDRDRHSTGSRERDADRWTPEEFGDDRRHRRRREMDRERWCCPDWDEEESDKHPNRYAAGRWSSTDATKWRSKHDDRYYSRDTQESPWEDEYANEPEDTHSSRYLGTKQNWKRPSSASEMDRKTGEIKSRQGQYYMGTGGSDGERDRRYKSGRRSRSRDSQFPEPSSHGRHKADPNAAVRGPHRVKPHSHQKTQFESDFAQDMPSKKVDNSKLELSNKKTSTLAARKKTKDISKTEDITANTFPRKNTSRSQHMFENDFVPSETDSPLSAGINKRFVFENDFETSEAESPIATKPVKNIRQQSLYENDYKKRGNLNLHRTFDADIRLKDGYESKDPKISPRSRTSQKSPFEDDFSPPVEKSEIQLHENLSASSIKEETDGNEEDDSFSTNNFDRSTHIRKKILNKSRLSNSFHLDGNLKKSESVNIFARENDPFDDEFFSENHERDLQRFEAGKKKLSPRSTELKWSEDFEDFNVENRK